MFDLYDNDVAVKRFEKLRASEFGDELDLDSADYWFNGVSGKLVVNGAVVKRSVEFDGVKYDVGDVIDVISV